MAFKGTEKGLVLVLVAMLWSGAMAQSGCTSVLPNLAPCLNYITGNSSTPSSSCCSQPSNVVQSSPQCLCTALNGGAASLGININKTRALSLPSACNVQTPPISQCKVPTELHQLALQQILLMKHLQGQLPLQHQAFLQEQGQKQPHQ
nr:isoform 2 of non-specific lipid-transfer protein-like protein [Quercus suber]